MGMQPPAGTDRVVLRSSLRMTLASTVLLPGLGFLAVGLLTRNWGLIAEFAVIFVIVQLLLDSRRCAVLTDGGITITNLSTVHVPWPHVDAVELTSSTMGGTRVRVYDVVANRSRYLQAPIAFWGMGHREVQAAYELIHKTWLAHRGGPRPPVEQWARRPEPPGSPEG